MPTPPPTGRYETEIPATKGARAVAPGVRTDSLTPLDEFLQLLAKTVRQFHTYPETSPLCTEAVTACHRAFAALDRAERLALRVTPREFIVDDAGIGGGTVVEQELVRRLHRGGVATLEFERSASPRDFARFCADVIRCEELRDTTSFADLLVEHGVEAITARMARRPEVLQVGAPSASICDLVQRDQQRRRAAATAGPQDYLYPPEKGWVRLDPNADVEAVSLVDLAMLVDDPAEVATMLLRLTDEDAAGTTGRERALEQKFNDVAMLFAALDGHLARLMFGKLARAVLAIDPDRRKALLQRTILPGLLDGRAAGAVLRDFPDPDLVESLCLLLELETAAPELIGAALNRLDLPEARRQAVASLVDDRLNGEANASASASERDRAVDRYARRLVQVSAEAGKDFSEFAAFDLSIDDQALSSVADVRHAIDVADPILVQSECLWKLVRLEPNPALVETFLRGAMALLGSLFEAGRWQEVAAAAARYQRLSVELRNTRPDVVDVILRSLGRFWVRGRALALVSLQERDDEGRAIVSAMFDAFGPCLASGFVALLDDSALQAATRPLVPLLCDHAAVLAPGLAAHLADCGTLARRAIVRILGHAGGGYEVLLAGQLESRDEQTVRTALRSLARIGTARAAAVVAFQIQKDSPLSRAAEEALWHFPPEQMTAQLRELFGRREFVVQHPDTVARMIDRASQAGAGGLDAALENLEAYRFRLWKPDLVRVALKARGLRSR